MLLAAAVAMAVVVAAAVAMAMAVVVALLLRPPGQRPHIQYRYRRVRNNKNKFGQTSTLRLVEARACGPTYFVASRCTVHCRFG